MLQDVLGGLTPTQLAPGQLPAFAAGPGRKAIWAQSRDGVIGDGTTMPWAVPEDLKNFRALTTAPGFTDTPRRADAPALLPAVVMGRHTWLSLPPAFRPLPGRENLVLATRPAGSWSQGARVLAAATGHQGANLDSLLPADCWIIGGGQVYAAFMDLVDELFITVFDADLAPHMPAKKVFAPQVPADFVPVDAYVGRSQQGRYLVGPAALRQQPVDFMVLQLRRG